MMTQNLVNIGLGIGLLPDGTKPLPEPMLAYHKWSSEGKFTWNTNHNNMLQISHSKLSP